MKKIILAVALIFTMAFGISACTQKDNGNDTPETQNTNSSDQQGTEPDDKQKTDDVDVFSIKKEELPQLNPPSKDDYLATIKTNMGDIKLVLFPKYAPKTVENFVTHAKNGYYDGVIFHRIIEEFMIQGGDPEGTGAGGESIWGAPFEDEFSPYLYNIRGAISMANSGPNTNGSQFFIVQNTNIGDVASQINGFITENKPSEEVWATLQQGAGYYGVGFPEAIEESYNKTGGAIHLDYKHTVFGQVIEGMDIVDKIAKVEKMENDETPKEEVKIEKIEIETVK